MELPRELRARSSIALVVCAVIVTQAATHAIADASEETVTQWLPFIPGWFNDWRSGLEEKGLGFGATYIGDNSANVSGGMKQGAIHFGRLDLYVDADLEKLMGWTGARLRANMFEIYGRGLSFNYIGNLAAITKIEALPDTRLYEAYIEQNLWNRAVAIKVGQQAADVEFFDPQDDDLFINGTFGWPSIFAADLPSGGPAAPVAVPGIRVKANLSDQVTAFAAVFNGDSAGPGDGDPQLRDNHGLAFRVNDPPWLVGQVRWDYDVDLGGGPLAGNFTPGGWYHCGTFDVQRFTAEGQSLADPSGSGVAAKLRGNFGLFAVLVQTLYRPPSTTEKGVSASAPGVTAFARVAYSPADRNLIDLYVDGGIGFSGLVPGRPADRFGVAIAYMHISPAAQQLDRDTQFFSGLPLPVRSNEILLELVYEAHIKPGWLVAPYFQYVFRPSGGVANPNDPTGISRIRNAAIFGLMTTLQF